MQVSLPKNVTEAQTAAVDLITATGHAVLNGVAEIAPLSVETARNVFNEAATLATTLPAVKTPQDLVTLNTNYLEALRDSATSYSRSVYEVASETQAKLNSLFEAHVSELQKGVHKAIEEAASHAPAGANGVVDFLKSFTTASVNSFQEASNTLRKATETAVANATAAPAAAARKGKTAV